MNGQTLASLRERIHHATLMSEPRLLARLEAMAALSSADRNKIVRDAATLVGELRRDAPITFLQSFLTEYGLSNSEGVALMCLAEAFLRVPDVETLDQLIAEKIATSDWRAHAGQASAFLVNASTWALMLSGRLLSPEEDSGLASTVQRLLSRLGEPVIRVAMTEVMARMGEHFVIGESIWQAVKRSASLTGKGYRYSYDMLGESVRTEQDAQRCFDAYTRAIASIAPATDRGIRDNPGISVKLSALHPRFELLQKPTMFDLLVERTAALAAAAAGHNLQFNIDAEEMERLEITLDVVESVARRLRERDLLPGWEGFGVVVQAYSKRAVSVLDWLQALARELECRFTVRLVKGAYWDTEIKRAQVLGLPAYPVFTHKASTDIAYLAAARKLLGMQAQLYPQFATHNAHTLSAVLAMAEAGGYEDFEFQRLHGMGETLHQKIKDRFSTRHRIYAPVGEHRDLLAYLVRRLLENGANSSFVHQIRDHKIPVSEVAADPFQRLQQTTDIASQAIPAPPDLYAPRANSPGWDLSSPAQLTELGYLREAWRTHAWVASPLLQHGQEAAAKEAGSQAEDAQALLPQQVVHNPAQPDEVVGYVHEASAAQVAVALDSADAYQATWSAQTSAQRADLLRRAADELQENLGEALALLTREAGKTLADALGEWREAIDFLRYYAQQAELAGAQSGRARGIVVCISPWNFPLAIFTGQIAAALVTGNVVIAKPAEQTPLLATRMVQWLHAAGIPGAALQLLPGDGARLGPLLCADARVQGVCFTGSLDTARRINQVMASSLAPDAVFIAETGGQNAMIVDSTALPEQTVRDVITSAFNSAGQRCSALRILYLQEEIAEEFITMLVGAMDMLQLGDPWQLDTDIGPIIDAQATMSLRDYLGQNKILHQVSNLPPGNFVAPSLIRVAGIEALQGEVFGPVLHVATFKAPELDQVIAAINASGYGLTFAIHSRLTERVGACVKQLAVGNMYVNRNQVGAVVGSQAFGGEGLSGTGPKAGGPHYLRALRAPTAQPAAAEAAHTLPTAASQVALAQLQAAIAALHAQAWATKQDRLALLAPFCSPELMAAFAAIPLQQEMPGPTGEQNHLFLHGRGCALCLGPTPAAATLQALQALAFGGSALICGPSDQHLLAMIKMLGKQGVPIGFCEGTVAAESLALVEGIDLVACTDRSDYARQLKRVLATREGRIIPLVNEPLAPYRYFSERLVCTDTTAAGGNVTLMAAVS